MSDIWVYKADGTKQCGLGTEIPLADMEKELAALIGQGEILGREKRTLPFVFPAVCGGPTGRVNAYSITEEGAYKLFHGFIGPNGFKLWVWSAHKAEAAAAKGLRGAETTGDWSPFPLSAKVGRGGDATQGAFANAIAALGHVGTHPVLIRELIGHSVRYYKQGDSLTLDYRPSRVNIEHDDKNVITNIWFG